MMMQGSSWIDVHCHILPYVDDGAETLDTARELLQEQVEQGVGTICLTPHCRTNIFEVPPEKVESQYTRLRQIAEQEFPTLRLLHSREYYFDRKFSKLLENGGLNPLGNGNCVLVEFSRNHSLDDLQNAVRQIVRVGYCPIIAHIERYPAAREESDAVQRLVELGAQIQMNAGAILGWEGLRRKLFCGKLLRAKQVHLVASDAHDPVVRRPNLGDCARHLTKKYGEQTAKRLLLENPEKILQGNSPESGVDKQ